MKFENPIMNISMFEVTDVITTSDIGGDQPKDQAADLARTYLNENAPADAVKVTF